MATLIMTNFHLYLMKLWWQFFQMFVYGDVVMLKLGGIDPQKLLQYRATFICQYGLCCCIVWPSFPFDCFLNIWATCENFLGKWFTQMVYPPGQKNARTPIKIKEACRRSSSFSNAYWFFFNPHHFENSTTRRTYQGERVINLKKIIIIKRGQRHLKSGGTFIALAITSKGGTVG